MFKTILVILSAPIFVSSAWADDGLCKTMAALAKTSAEQREAGVARDALLRRFVQEGKLEKGDSATPFVFNTVVWVYDENVPAKTAYRQMYDKCSKALAKRR